MTINVGAKRMDQKRRNALQKITDEVTALTASPLYAYRVENGYIPVIGEGSEEAKIVFVGEAPGKNEAKTGKPFCGSAGKVLDSMLSSIRLVREDIYITNIVKDRPEQNRDPIPEEIALYGPFLDRQMAIIEPRIVVALGRYAMNYIMEMYGLQDQIETIGNAHGKRYETRAPYGPVTIIPQYHPAATIYNRKLIPVLEQDFKVIREVLDSSE